MKIDWKELYETFIADLCDIDCGTLCAPDNDGIPACCVDCDPVLFAKELKWVRKKTALWRRKPVKTKQDRKAADKIEDYIRYARCKGIEHCDRNYRSLCCRFFPLEPYFDRKKRFVGLTYIYRLKDRCPVIGNPDVTISQEYVNQSIKVWRKIFRAFPPEIDAYVEESEKLRKKFRKKKKTIAVFEAE